MKQPAGRVPLTLCRHGGHTCAACCWGARLRRNSLRSTLRRQTRLGRYWFRPGRLPGRWALLLHEVTARTGLDLVLGVLLLVPLLSAWLRPRIQRHLTCAFLGFEDAQDRRVGCLLHPTRWQGQEVRPQAAFALLPGFACGPPGWYCRAAQDFTRTSWEEHRDFADRTRRFDWYDFSRIASTFRAPARPGRPGEPCGCGTEREGGFNEPNR